MTKGHFLYCHFGGEEYFKRFPWSEFFNGQGCRSNLRCFRKIHQKLTVASPLKRLEFFRLFD